MSTPFVPVAKKQRVEDSLYLDSTTQTPTTICVTEYLLLHDRRFVRLVPEYMWHEMMMYCGERSSNIKWEVALGMLRSNVVYWKGPLRELFFAANDNGVCSASDVLILTQSILDIVKEDACRVGLVEFLMTILIELWEAQSYWEHFGIVTDESACVLVLFEMIHETRHNPQICIRLLDVSWSYICTCEWESIFIHQKLDRFLKDVVGVDTQTLKNRIESGTKCTDSDVEFYTEVLLRSNYWWRILFTLINQSESVIQIAMNANPYIWFDVLLYVTEFHEDILNVQDTLHITLVECLSNVPDHYVLCVLNTVYEKIQHISLKLEDYNQIMLSIVTKLVSAGRVYYVFLIPDIFGVWIGKNTELTIPVRQQRDILENIYTFHNGTRDTLNRQQKLDLSVLLNTTTVCIMPKNVLQTWKAVKLYTVFTTLVKCSPIYKYWFGTDIVSTFDGLFFESGNDGTEWVGYGGIGVFIPRTYLQPPNSGIRDTLMECIDQYIHSMDSDVFREILSLCFVDQTRISNINYNSIRDRIIPHRDFTVDRVMAAIKTRILESKRRYNGFEDVFVITTL